MRSTLINIILSVAALIAGFQIHKSIFPESRQPKVDSGFSARYEAAQTKDQPLSKEVLHFSSYKTIGEKNLFRPERRKWSAPQRAGKIEKKVARKEAEPKSQPPMLTLFGTIIYGEDVRIAIIKNAGGRRGTVESKKSYHLGDEISGYSIQEIHEEKVVLAKGDEVIELKLREGKPRPRVSAVPRQRPKKGKQKTASVSRQKQIKRGKKGEPDRIVVKGPGGREIVKRKKIIRTPFGPKTIYIEER